MYAIPYEKDISNRPLRCPVDPFATVSAYPKSRGKTPHPLLARCPRRHLLRLEKWLSLAAFAPRLSSVVYRLLPFQKIPIERVVVLHPQRAACGREEEGGQGSPTDGRHHGFPKRQERRRIGLPKWLRRPQENLKGRKRHLLVDTSGLPLSIHVSSADVQDRVGAQYLLAGMKALLPRLKKIWADGAYR